MGRPPSDLDGYLDWQERIENYKVSGLSAADGLAYTVGLIIGISGNLQ